MNSTIKLPPILATGLEYAKMHNNGRYFKFFARAAPIGIAFNFYLRKKNLKYLRRIKSLTSRLHQDLFKLSFSQTIFVLNYNYCKLTFS